ncbi:MAG TPA: hypothetical protein DIU07_22055 [Rhodobacteraceae bacterium]|nr:hypothetical protein [Paracoccaceae bacterium]
MSVYATPHRWTPFHGQSADRRVIQADLRFWDYKHQVLETPRVPAWRVFLWLELIEAVLQLRPKALWRAYLQPDPVLRHAQRWYSRMGRRVWLRETRDALLHRARPGSTVAEFWGPSNCRRMRWPGNAGWSPNWSGFFAIRRVTNGRSNESTSRTWSGKPIQIIGSLIEGGP